MDDRHLMLAEELVFAAQNGASEQELILIIKRIFSQIMANSNDKFTLLCLAVLPAIEMAEGDRVSLRNKLTSAIRSADIAA
ncbi:MAG: hypothetical protein EBT20_07130 [Alphaproteobacteria bacterium]|nr:hypothetical protein [Alphaproteobacteria bacterium]